MSEDVNRITIFYDGQCGLCHTFVRFVLSQMTIRNTFYFAPQEGKTFNLLKTKFPDVKFPDSIIVYNHLKQQIYTKSIGVAFILTSLKWPWKGLGLALKGVPLVLADLGYVCVAKTRYRLFKKPNSLCPLVPEKWKRYFIID